MLRCFKVLFGCTCDSRPSSPKAHPRVQTEPTRNNWRFLSNNWRDHPYVACSQNILFVHPDCDFMFVRQDHPVVDWFMWHLGSDQHDHGPVLNCDIRESPKIDGEWYKFSKNAVNVRYWMAECID
jgi:hypothetical protein